MSQDLLKELLDFGALGIFAGFLVWQHLGMQKRLDRSIGDFHAELKRITEFFDERTKTNSERHETVVNALREDQRGERERFEQKVSELQRELLARERQSVMNFKLHKD